MKTITTPTTRRAYTVRISRERCPAWPLAVCDLIDFNREQGNHVLLVMPQADLDRARAAYRGHSCRDSFLREAEPAVLIHSTPFPNWEAIRRDGALKSWNLLREERAVWEDCPIGSQLGDPAGFSDYIMLGCGITGEIVVNSRQQGRIVMDAEAKYRTGARLYFDAARIARDGLLVRDGCHWKVRDTLPLQPYLIWAATWDLVGLPGPVSTPAAFAEQSDARFRALFDIFS